MYELVTVTVSYKDYQRLRDNGAAIDQEVSLALANYLKLHHQGELPKGDPSALTKDGHLRTIRCALPKNLCDQVRALGGRFDLHTVEAVRLYLP